MAITKWSTPDVMAITKWSIQGAAMANSCQHNGAMARNAQTFLRPRWFNPHQPQPCGGSSVLSAGCWTARSDIGWWWPSRLVATASEDHPDISPTN